MPKRILQTTGLLAALLAMLWVGCADGDEVDFNHDIRPILNERCVVCHGGIKRQGDLSLLFRVDAMQPAESGKQAVVPGNPGTSELLRRVSHHDPDERMPQEGPPLNAEEISKFRRWIAQGAPWADHWAYVSPTEPERPAVSDPAWPRNGLDYFILARLDQENLAPSPRADCPTLVRRVSLDLIGLPPTPEQVASVCDDSSSARYETFVDSLLASPRYGERWAAMWLDLARYADSKGYEKDIPRTIWRFRDWVIDAFNQDMPFDQFTIEQLAGDLLPDPTEAQLIATAFHRNTMTNTEGGTDDEEFRVAAVIDRVNTTWEVWQGTSFACTQCHGHPYDPFRHEDYYASFAFFNNTADWDQDNERPTLPLFPEGNEAEGLALLDEIEAIEKRMIEIASTPEMEEARRAWEGQLDDPQVVGKVLGTRQNEVRRIAQTPEAERDDAQRAHIRYIYAEIVEDEQMDALRQERRAKQIALRDIKPILTPVMKEVPPTQRRTTHVFERGNFLLRTEAVEPGVPASMPPLPDDAPRNRLGLSQWLVSPDHPLTARVMVNRFWEQLFGIGIVETLEDFGTRGLPPSHPELLDWLALQFMHEHQWSVKALLKQIVTSATYQQASSVTPEVLERDPRNRLLARGPRFRLAAEQIRDQALAVSGLLSDEMFGPSVMPPQPPGLWQNPYSGARWQTSDGQDRYRRGLYTYWRRTVPYPSMVTFDSPSREFCVSRRVRTNTPLQALVTLNDPAFVEAAQALARRMLDETAIGDDPVPVEDWLTTGYKLALARDPSAETLFPLRTLYDEAAQHYASSPDDAAAMTGQSTNPELAALTVVANAILNLDGFVMKE